MPRANANPPDTPSCYPPVLEPGILQNQPLDPDVFRHGARDLSGRFAKGHSGNPSGRPPGIPNPKRRRLDFVNRPPKPGAVEALIDRKPYLLRRFAQQVLPYRRVRLDPAERLGIDLSAVRTPREAARLMTSLWAAIARGEIAPTEALQIARRVARVQNESRRPVARLR